MAFGSQQTALNQNLALDFNLFGYRRDDTNKNRLSDLKRNWRRTYLECRFGNYYTREQLIRKTIET